MRVSMRRPYPNSFHNRVPTGNSQASTRAASIAVPGGSAIQRCLRVPSDHSGYCGEKGTTPAASVVVVPGASRPVSLSSRGSGGAAGAACTPETAAISAEQKRSSVFMGEQRSHR
jgi:hypothetical protein